jgi:PAS domain S-box-containing protein
MTTRRRAPVAIVVAAALATVTTFFLGALAIASYRSDKKQQMRDLKRLMAIQAKASAVALALPAWNIDRAQIDEVIEAMAQPNSIYAIRVAVAGRTHGLARNSAWKLVPWDGKSVPEGMISEQAPVIFNGNDIGTVQLYATPKFIDEDLQQSMLSFISTIVFADVLLVLSVYLILLRTVVRPIMDIERYAVAVSAGGGALSVPLGIGSAMELVSLRSSIESMVRLLEHRYAELQEGEERFRTIFESVNDAIFILHSETGAILDVNARMCEMSGYTREEAKDLDIGQLSSGIPPYTRKTAIAAVRRARRGDQQLFEWQARHRDGHLFWVEVNMRAAIIGGVGRVIVVARDITQRKEMEEALRRSETMSAMGTLVAGVAHEVRNPLFGIAATVDAFEAEFGGGAGLTEYMATLRNDVARLSRLMHDLLEYGRPQKLARHVQSVEPVIAEAVRICSPRARERHIQIQPQIEESLPYAAIDADRMLQVLKNVVENAIEFSAADNVVSIDARADRDTAPQLVLTISDHGPGFRSEDLPHVFKPFFTRRGGGSGLGLAIVQKIVTEHGGTIAATNGAGGGGRIEIRLPVTGGS